MSTAAHNTSNAGHFDIHILEQHVTWVDYYGKVHQICEMESAYLYNVITFLEDRATSLHAAYSLIEDYDGVRERNGVLERLQVPKTGQIEPIAWLNSMPLLRALRGCYIID